MEIVLAKRFYRAAAESGRVLYVDPAYFELTGRIEEEAWTVGIGTEAVAPGCIAAQRLVCRLMKVDMT